MATAIAAGGVSHQGPKVPAADYTETARWIVLVALMLGTILEVLDVSIVNVAIPDMMGNLGATLDQINWVSTGYIIANVIVLPLSGWLSAYLGRRNYLAASIVVFTGASFLCGLSATLPTLVLWRVVQGAGGAALLSTAMATLLDIFPTEKQGLVAAVFGTGVMVAPTVGPMLGGWITDNYSWPWIFFINLPLGIPAAVLTLLFMRTGRESSERRARVDLIGIAILTAGIGSLQVVLERGEREGWFDSSLIVWLSVIAGVALAAFVAWELHVPNPCVNLRVLRHRGLTAATVFSIIVGFGIYGSLFILPVFLQEVRGYTPTQTGTMLVVQGLAAAASMAVVGKLVHRFAPRTVVAAGAVLFAGGMYLLSRVTLLTGPEHLTLGFVLWGGALGPLFVPLSLAALADLPSDEMADGSGLFNLTRQWGGSLGIALLSTLIDHRRAFHRSVLVEHISVYKPVALERWVDIQRYLVSTGTPPGVAPRKALAVLDGIVQGQSYVLAFEDAFLAIALAFIASLPLLLLFSRRRSAGSPTATY